MFHTIKFMKKEILYLSIIFNRNNVLIPCFNKTDFNPNYFPAPKPSKIARQSRKRDVKTNQPKPRIPRLPNLEYIRPIHPRIPRTTMHLHSQMLQMWPLSALHHGFTLKTWSTSPSTVRTRKKYQLDNIYINNP